jgi:ADP-ribose pyrophosphatase YjhB (NUDIX family)
MERRVNVRGIVIDDEGRIFAVKHQDKDGNESEYWATPGGGLDPEESLHDGLVREFIEELGVEPKVGRLLFVQQFTGFRRTGEKREQMEFFFHIENTSDFLQAIDLSKSSHGFELARVDFIRPDENDILPAFLHTTDIKSHIENNLPVYIIDNLKETPR